ncbi:hypothetical protein NAT47_07010 [Flavobacterium sp. HXWNR69]|uniref:Uncharacterized protein n=1 Tax=Flavobacterium fragile TaxID=2949085 RepID=A0ABT0THV1_9FLAO|nr:hypothetical protein [Flavobacterium sp. HXWNR69]MCL9770161.1 hypothetical protein [Flavobacterium sp. HXWNR69]
MKNTPKEQAKELIEKLYPFTWQVGFDYDDDYEQAIECALISVDLILDSNNLIFNKEYWVEVREAINSYKNK